MAGGVCQFVRKMIVRTQESLLKEQIDREGCVCDHNINTQPQSLDQMFFKGALSGIVHREVHGPSFWRFESSQMIRGIFENPNFAIPQIVELMSSLTAFL